MSLLRAAIFGGIVAIVVPTFGTRLGGQLGDFLRSTSSHVQLGDSWIRFSPALFAIVAILTFGFFQIWRR